MINEPLSEQLAVIPKLYETEHIPHEDKIVYVHFHIAQSHFFIVEFDQVDTMFGFCILNNNLEMSEWGYVSFEELKSIKIFGLYEVEFDTQWKPIPARDVDLIRQGGGIFSSTDSAPNRDPWTWYSLRSQPNT